MARCRIPCQHLPHRSEQYEALFRHLHLHQQSRSGDAKGDLAIEEAEKLFDRLASSPAAGVLRWNQQVSGADMAARFKGGAIARALDEAQYLFAMNQSLTKEQLLAKIDTEFVPPKTA